MSQVVCAPVSGLVIPLAKVQDPVFSSHMVGEGLAVEPDAAGSVRVLSPFAGKIAASQPHAFAVQDEFGNAVLVHLGLDTVELRGAPYHVLAAKDRTVAALEPVVEWDVAQTLTAGLDCTVIVTALQVADPDEKVIQLASGHVEAGEPLFAIG